MKKTTTPVASPDVEHGTTNTATREPEVQSPQAPEEALPVESSRDRLKAVSAAVRSDVESGKFKNINDALIEKVYQDETHHEFKSYDEWKKEGYQVREGEKAFHLWGKPKEHVPGTSQHTPDNVPKEEHDSYFPVVPVFSDAQVDPIDRDPEQDQPQKPDTRNKKSDQKTIEDLGNMRRQNSHSDIDR